MRTINTHRQEVWAILFLSCIAWPAVLGLAIWEHHIQKKTAAIEDKLWWSKMTIEGRIR